MIRVLTFICFGIREETMLHIISAASCYGCPCLIRVSQINREKIGRLMDGGAGKIPLADTFDASQIREIVKTVKHLPAGDWGVSTESGNNHCGLGKTIHNKDVQRLKENIYQKIINAGKKRAVKNLMPKE